MLNRWSFWPKPADSSTLFHLMPYYENHWFPVLPHTPSIWTLSVATWTDEGLYLVFWRSFTNDAGRVLGQEWLTCHATEAGHYTLWDTFPDY